MNRHVVALMAGLPRNQDLLQEALKPLLELKRKGVIHRIVYVTWDRSDLDAAVAPIAAMPDIELVRTPEPVVTGSKSTDSAYSQKSFVCQTRSIAAGLEHIDDPDALVLRSRPDIVYDVGFLASKILAFDYLCAPSDLPERYPVGLPPSPFAAKVWVPWADSNQPFFMEDATCLGLSRDLAKLATREVVPYMLQHEDVPSMWIMHALRYIHPFLKDHPILERFLREFHLFPKEQAYRAAMLPVALPHPFFLHLLFLNAWLMATSFHIDCGHTGQIMFYPLHFLDRYRASGSLSERPVYSPYDSIEAWRSHQEIGSFVPCIARPYGRLMDDCWQNAVFRRSQLSDVTNENRLNVLENLAHYGSGALAAAEDDFYALMTRFQQAYRSTQVAQSA